jgi:cytoskeletal protein CcmA (bactofilin family)
MGIFGKTPDAKPSDPVAPPKPAAPPPSPAAAAAAPAAASAPRPSSTTCVIGGKTIIKGEISGEEEVLVEGTVEGQIRIQRDLRVGPTGVVKATIEAQSVVVSGEVIGDCMAVTRVEIQASGRVTGNIKAPKIVIAEGAMFKGTSDMSPRRDERKDKAAS